MGKKKGGNKNKLAKMSDEERARYLQHRADMEEEARRRKQQLIATFMKVSHRFSVKKIVLNNNLLYLPPSRTS